MIILPLLSFHGSPTEVKEEQEKRQQQHFAYATATVGTASSSSFTSSLLNETSSIHNKLNRYGQSRL